MSEALKFGSRGSACQTIGGMHDRPPHCEQFVGNSSLIRFRKSTPSSVPIGGKLIASSLLIVDFSPTSVQLQGEISDALPRKRHQKRHLECCTAYLLSRGPQVRVLRGAPSH